MGWWDALTPGQQRTMMQRFVIQTPVAATPTAPSPTPTPVVIQPRRNKLKKLHIEDFRGTPTESIEAWLSTVEQAVQRQAMLGGETWTSAELYYGVTAHLKGDANKWLVIMSEGLEAEDCTFEYLANRLRKKYGRRENTWQIQKRLGKREQQPGERVDSFANSLTNIGFGKRVSAEAYLEAFYDGLNNQEAAAHIRTMGPQTLNEAVEFTINGYGEYGEGRKVTSWRSAQRHYRKGKADTKEAGTAPPKKSEAKPEVADLINWKQLGLGFGGSDVGPRYDDAGKAISGLANTAGLKDGALPLAALQAIAVAAGMGQAAAARIPATKVEASKTKTARTLEVKAEARPTESVDLPAFAQPPTTNQRQGGGQQYGGRGGGGDYYGGQYDGGGYGGGGRGGYGGDARSGYGGGRGGFGGGGRSGGRGGAGALSNYGPSDGRPIMQRNAESTCHYWGQNGHWWRECRVRIAGTQPAVNQQPPPAQQQQPTAEVATSAAARAQSTPATAGNGARQ
uniref:Retrotransposon gag domain-containing protein n=1 Tax=Phytophthora fragariae TaxID=53985 RepID=A0A6A3DL78_9STRA|nr:hypothetical protein PF009_g28522 [Phytophthora fragariae]